MRAIRRAQLRRAREPMRAARRERRWTGKLDPVGGGGEVIDMLADQRDVLGRGGRIVDRGEQVERAVARGVVEPRRGDRERLDVLAARRRRERVEDARGGLGVIAAGKLAVARTSWTPSAGVIAP